MNRQHSIFCGERKTKRGAVGMKSFLGVQDGATFPGVLRLVCGQSTPGKGIKLFQGVQGGTVVWFLGDFGDLLGVDDFAVTIDDDDGPGQ